METLYLTRSPRRPDVLTATPALLPSGDVIEGIRWAGRRSSIGIGEKECCQLSARGIQARTVNRGRPSKTWGLPWGLPAIGPATDRSERRESGMIRVATAYWLCSPPGFGRSHAYQEALSSVPAVLVAAPPAPRHNRGRRSYAWITPTPLASGRSVWRRPRVPLDRERRARFRFLLSAHHRGGRITRAARDVGEALLRRLSGDGRCDPSHDTLAAEAACSARTVRRASAPMRALGLVRWQMRLVRTGWRAEQTSNAYELVPELGALSVLPRVRCGGQAGRETRRIDISYCPEFTAAEWQAAQDILAQRRAVVQQRLLTRRMAGGQGQHREGLGSVIGRSAAG